MRDTCEGSSELDGPARPFSAQPEKYQRDEATSWDNGDDCGEDDDGLYFFILDLISTLVWKWLILKEMI